MTQLFFNLINDFSLIKNPQGFQLCRSQFMHADIVWHLLYDTAARVELKLRVAFSLSVTRQTAPVIERVAEEIRKLRDEK